MIEENENEKSLQFIKIITTIIIYSVISVVIGFLFCLSKVDAVSQYHYRNSSNVLTSWANTTQDTTYNFGTQNIPTSYVVAMQFRDSTTFTGNNKYDYYVSGRYWIVVNGERTINFNIQTAIFNGSNVASTGNACVVNATQSTKLNYYPLLGYKTRKDITFSVSCSGLFSNGYYPLITIQFKSDTAVSGEGQLTFNNSSMVQTTSSIDSSSIINNQNNNTNTIVNNNNQNTQSIINGQQETTDAVNGLKDSITSEDSADLSNLDIELNENDPLSNLLMLPVNLANVIIQATSGSCEDYSFGQLFGHNLKLKCIDFPSLLGSNLYHTIDILIAFFMIYQLFMMCITIYNDITSLRDGFDDLYTPAHEGYKTKHGGGERV